MIKKKISDLGIDIRAKEEEYKALKCGFWEALFTLGIACAIKAGKRAEIRRLQEKLRGEIRTYQDVNKRMKYFDGIKKLGKTLEHEAIQLLDDAKRLKEAINRVLNNLEMKWTDEDLKDIFEDGDMDWIEGFTDEYLEDILAL
jgi:hypothetical protein